MEILYGLKENPTQHQTRRTCAHLGELLGRKRNPHFSWELKQCPRIGLRCPVWVMINAEHCFLQRNVLPSNRAKLKEEMDSEPRINSSYHPAESGEQHKRRLSHLHRDGLSRLRVKGLTDLKRDEFFLSTVGKIWRIGLQHDKELKYIINPGDKQMDCSQKFLSKR